MDGYKLDTDLAYVLGTLAGDGCIYIRKDICKYVAALCVTDYDFAKKFRDCIFKIFGVKYRIRRKLVDGLKTMYGVTITRKKFVLLLRKWMPDYGNYEFRIPEEIIKANNTIKKYFLRGYFDSDGGVELFKDGKFRTVSAVSISKEGMREVEGLLNSLGLSTSMYVGKTKVGRPFYRCKIFGLEKAKRFRKKVGFSIKRKEEALHLGIKTLEKTFVAGWNRHETRFLKDNYTTLKDEEIAKKIGRTRFAVRTKRKKLGLNKSFVNAMRAWSVKEEKIMREFYAVKSNAALAKLTGKSKKQVESKGFRMGLKKSYRKSPNLK